MGGIEPGNAAYMREPAIAGIHERLIAGDPLARDDIAIVLEELRGVSAGVVADFGCGTGRAIGPLVRRGWQVIGIDLSQPMLSAARQRLDAEQVSPDRFVLVQSALTEMPWLEDRSLSAGICLFSTLGMIRDRQWRQRFLAEASRATRPGGLLLVHAHNLWHQRRFPGGWRWIAGSWVRSLTGRSEWGDRWANTAGVEGLFIHSFRLGELLRDLRQAGWRPQTIWLHPDPGPGSTATAPFRGGEDLLCPSIDLSEKGAGRLLRQAAFQPQGWTISNLCRDR